MESTNGNISAMKWSVGFGEGSVKQLAYDFSYDAMNRLLSATNKQSTALNSWAAGEYDENGLSYDLNGNILGLQRKGKGGVTIDNLVYNYGPGSPVSNKLLYVKDIAPDATHKVKGFNDVNAGDVQDYTYDDNGNLTRDRNKGIGTTISDATNIITYNFLNLPETVTKGENNVRYIYDATGRKLAQVTAFGAVSKQVDYIGELQYENDALQFINTAEGRIAMGENKVMILHSGETEAGAPTFNSATVALATQNGGEKYLQITSNGTRSGLFPIGGTIAGVVPGEKYRIRVKGYNTGVNSAHLLIQADGTDLNWPGAKLPSGVASESWVEQIVTIPAGKTTLKAGLVWNTVPITEIMFLNEFEITKISATTSPEYQYHLKDHLGNVRVTFTTKQDTDQSLATLETLASAQEQPKFIYYDEAVKVNANIFDHSNEIAGVPETLPPGNINIHKEAESFSAQSGTTTTTGVVGSCDNGDWLQYNAITMTGITGLRIQCASATASIGRVEVRIGTTTGTLLGYLQGPNTGSVTAFSSYVIPLAASTGAQNIVLVFKDASAIMNVDWIEFIGPGVAGVAVKGISLQNTSLTLSVGQTGRLLKTITPSEATDQTVAWVSSNPSVATVNTSTGVVTAVSNGTTMITVTTTNGGYTAKALIRVKPSNINMVLNPEFETNTANWVLGDFTGPNYSPGGSTFSSVTVAGMSGAKAMYVDVVNTNAGSWTLQPYSVLSYKLEVGKTYEISFMAKAAAAKSIGVALRGEQTNSDYWNTNVGLTTTPQSFGPYQFTLNDYTVTANSSSTAAFYLADGVNADVWIDKVIVKDITPGETPATGVSVSPTTLSLSVGQHGQITSTVAPANALNQVTWTSSNTAVAIVNGDGFVTALAAGTSSITATSIAGNYTASTTLTVTAAASNSLLNGEFDAGTANWTLGDWTGAGYTPGGNVLSAVTGAALSGTNAGRIDVVNANAEGWTLQPYNRLSFLLENGRTYEISFMAKGQTTRNLTAALRGEQTNTDFWSSGTLSLTTTGQTFGPYSFTLNNPNVDLNTTFTMAFYLANGVISDVWIDKVILKDITTGWVAATSLTISPSRLALSTGQTGQLNRNLVPANATNTSVTWTSSDPEIATVNGNGLVTAVSTGTVTITAKSANGALVAKATVSVNPGATSYSTRLTGMPNDKYGLTKSLAVMPGDTIEAEVWAKYLDNNSDNWTEALKNLMIQISQGTAPTGTFVDGGAPGSIGGTTFPYIGQINRSGDSGNGPKAYLNYILFNKNFVAIDGGFRRLSDTPKEDGTDVDHEKLAFEGASRIIVKEPGYVYIYLSNENDTPVDVYFDDFKVKHIKGPIVSSQDYYPFGLTFNSYRRENSVQQAYQYNGKELQDELNLQWMDYGARMYDAQIGRWHVVDLLSNLFPDWSPYNYAYNNPVRYIDPLGMANEDEVDKRPDNEFEGRGANGSWNFREASPGASDSDEGTTVAGCAYCSNGFGFGGDLLAKPDNAKGPDPDLSSDARSWQYVPVGPDKDYQATGVSGLYFDYITTYTDVKGKIRIDYIKYRFNTLYFEFPRVREDGTVIGAEQAAMLSAAAKDLAEENIEMILGGQPQPLTSQLETTMLTELRATLAPFGARVSLTPNYGPVPISPYGKTLWGNGR